MASDKMAGISMTVPDPSPSCRLCLAIEAGKLEEVLQQIHIDREVCACGENRTVYRTVKLYQGFLRRARTDSVAKALVWRSADVHTSKTRSLVLLTTARLLAGGVPLNYCTGVETPLMAALTTCDEDLLTALLDHGADVNLCDGLETMSALGLAILLNQPALLTLLLKHGGKVNSVCCGHLLPIQLAVNKTSAVSGLLLQWGADVHLVRSASLDQRLSAWQSPLLVAVLHGNVHLGRLLLEHGEDVNQTFPDSLESPIHQAVRNQDGAMIRLLVQFGADLNKPNFERHTPVGLALMTDDPVATEIAKTLVRCGASPNRRTRISFFQKTYTPLHIACFKGNMEFVRFLVEEVCSNGYPPLESEVAESSNVSIKDRYLLSCEDPSPSAPTAFQERFYKLQRNDRLWGCSSVASHPPAPSLPHQSASSLGRSWRGSSAVGRVSSPGGGGPPRSRSSSSSSSLSSSSPAGVGPGPTSASSSVAGGSVGGARQTWTHANVSPGGGGGGDGGGGGLAMAAAVSPSFGSETRSGEYHVRSEMSSPLSPSQDSQAGAQTTLTAVLRNPQGSGPAANSSSGLTTSPQPTGTTTADTAAVFSDSVPLRPVGSSTSSPETLSQRMANLGFKHLADSNVNAVFHSAPLSPVGSSSSGPEPLSPGGAAALDSQPLSDPGVASVSQAVAGLRMESVGRVQPAIPATYKLVKQTGFCGNCHHKRLDYGAAYSRKKKTRTTSGGKGGGGGGGDKAGEKSASGRKQASSSSGGRRGGDERKGSLEGGAEDLGDDGSPPSPSPIGVSSQEEVGVGVGVGVEPVCRCYWTAAEMGLRILNPPTTAWACPLSPPAPTPSQPPSLTLSQPAPSYPPSIIHPSSHHSQPSNQPSQQTSQQTWEHPTDQPSSQPDAEKTENFDVAAAAAATTTTMTNAGVSSLQNRQAVSTSPTETIFQAEFGSPGSDQPSPTSTTTESKWRDMFYVPEEGSGRRQREEVVLAALSHRSGTEREEALPALRGREEAGSALRDTKESGAGTVEEEGSVGGSNSSQSQEGSVLAGSFQEGKVAGSGLSQEGAVGGSGSIQDVAVVAGSGSSQEGAVGGTGSGFSHNVAAFLNQTGHDGSTALFMAVYDGNVALVDYLLAQGSNPNFCSHHGNFFHAAVLSQSLPLIRRALQLGCHINELNVFGNSPLTLVSRLDLAEACELLVTHGADMDCRDRYRETPLLASVYFGCEMNARTLIQHGAQLDLVDDNHTSALYWAIFNNRERTLRLLLLAGAHLTPHRLAQYPRNIRVLCNKALMAFLQHTVTQPRSLQDLATLATRRHLAVVLGGRSILSSCLALPLPSALRHQLCLHHFVAQVDAILPLNP